MFYNLLNNPIFNLISPIVGIIGIILAIIFYIRSKKAKIPLYYINSYNIISRKLKNEIDDLKIFYANDRIFSLTVSKIAIWNTGNDTILFNDIPNSDKFRIIISDNYEIYNYELLPLNEDSPPVKLSKKDNKILIDFDFIEPKRGFAIKLIHSGESGKVLKIKGKVIGGTKIKQYGISDEISFPIIKYIKIPSKYFFLILTLIYIGMAGYLIETGNNIYTIGAFLLLTITMISIFIKFIGMDMPKNLRNIMFE